MDPDWFGVNLESDSLTLVAPPLHRRHQSPSRLREQEDRTKQLVQFYAQCLCYDTDPIERNRNVFGLERIAGQSWATGIRQAFRFR